MAEKQKVKNKPVAKKPQDKQGPKVVFLFFLLFIGLYFGFAGWTRTYYEALAQRAETARVDVNCDDPNTGIYDENDFYCTEEDYFAAQQLKLIENAGLYWIFFLPDPMHLILSAFAFGFTGSLVKIARLAMGKKGLPDLDRLSLSSSMGGMTAIMLIGVLYLFPSAVSGANITLKPTLEPFLCIFAGAYSEHIQKWFQSVINRFFNVKKEKT